MSLKSMPKSFDLTCKKGYYPHFLNTANNLENVGPYPEPKFYGADYMSGDERAQIWNGMRSKKTKFSAISRSSWPTAWTMSMY
jgi:hypothetical protein